MELVCLGLALRTNGYHQKYRLTRRDGEVAPAQAGDNLFDNITIIGVSRTREHWTWELPIYL